ncbi:MULTISPECIES: oxidoreductase [Sphingobium]|uniref:oxidoreductase n=1 Tax=Sphingobium TaxID=165695 RepID=UPI0015EBD39A|nr:MULTISPECIES: oxidoreductase [Sphingobium]MCW2362357.1 NAD(P)-dependent dehydrogenase (short-subunit alcohol dehydrogenase family) [Sphingobium sp. B10D3B]MCW2400964.1 NAD(P)-dependent dehydrogenase (short-subunit alcohol dehydrogenase family) [Sphingobium sp. B10D7B]MCW2407943.1 NAD(P)-dependent dehydrogenase (short-subunit alcohol dehydrogenase family) [Sphingobium xanthum]
MVNWLITGIGGGLGEALAQAALDRGDKVFGTSRSVEACARFAAIAPGRSFAHGLDFGDQAAPAALVALAEQTMGSVDRLVNNAGYGLIGAVEEITLDDARALFDVNLFGAIAMIQSVLPAMRARKAGHIVNITSVSGLAPWAGTSIYGASKYALECIGQTLAQEVAPLGIKVTNVAPGGLRTNFAGGSLRLADRMIADYEGSAHFARQSLKEGVGKEKGDPIRAAAAILAALDAPQPPMHLLLGEDALHYAEGQTDLLRAEMERWKDYSLSIAYPAEEMASADA